nr:hypothetical protein CFP56_10378 [Quercus suber]
MKAPPESLRLFIAAPRCPSRVKPSIHSLLSRDSTCKQHQLPHQRRSHLPQLFTTSSTTMSAPKQGRQSPEPESQTKAQQGTSAKPNDQGAAPSKDHAADASKEALKNLDSNPTGVLEGEAQKKTAKD